MARPDGSYTPRSPGRWRQHHPQHRGRHRLHRLLHRSLPPLTGFPPRDAPLAPDFTRDLVVSFLSKNTSRTAMHAEPLRQFVERPPLLAERKGRP